ncbi:MAG: hypothetical protein GX575_25670 [Candidatus Anammoximicrobium sp.]|nr:hypothetical protein [Candidatus Anammoximicrobium sp.]
MTTSERFENLLGVPSFHYSPVFGGEVRAVVRDFTPSVVAIEAPPESRDEFEWATDCWPTPVCSVVGNCVFPFVPGDSLLEAFRWARTKGIAVHLIDPLTRRRRDLRGCGLPDPSLAGRGGAAFREAVEAIETGFRTQGADLAREAVMAQRLRLLMERHERVLWVGGMAHWRRIVARLSVNGFAGPVTGGQEWKSPQRLRLSPSALVRLTGRYPWVVRRYAADPDHYDEMEAVRALALAALEERPELADLILLTTEEKSAPAWVEESGSPADVIRVVTYARNLAASTHLGDCPSLPDLLMSGTAVVGKRYAGRLFAIALEEDSPSLAAAGCGELELGAQADERSFRLGRSRLRLVPGWDEPARQGRSGWRLSHARTALGSPFEKLPRSNKDKREAWVCYPPDEESYEAFVGYVLRRASLIDPAEAKTVPFAVGLRDGIDVRTTLRRWQEGRIFVREESGARLHVTNGIIDWEHGSEFDDRLQGRVDNGWIDPDLLHVGSASRDGPYVQVRANPEVRLVRREFSLITLDRPTWLRGKDSPSFYDEVIAKLVELHGRDDNLYAWLDVFFAFCAGKPVVYYSRYVPSPQVHRVAWRHRVRVIHVPLQRIPKQLLARTRSFLFASLTRRQWDVMVQRVADGRAGWLDGEG